MSKLSLRDRLDIEVQMGRYERECGEVKVSHVNPSVFKQEPVAVISVREARGVDTDGDLYVLS
jgi:hypothetical protein